MKTNLTYTMLLTTAFTALLFAFSASANAQGFDANRRSEPNRPMTLPTASHRLTQPNMTPQNQPNSFSQHSTPQRQPQSFHQPQQHHASKPAQTHHQPTIHSPKPAPMPTICNDHHHLQPQVVVVGQAPRKPSLLEKIVNIFR